MSHLTTSQIFQTIDGTIANGTRTELLAHLEVCSQCRQQLEFQRRLERLVGSAPLAKPSQKFTEGVIAKVAPRAGKSYASKLIDNLSSIIAMAFVLTVVWYAANISVAASPPAQPSVFSEVTKAYVDYYSRPREYVAEDLVQLMGKSAKEQSAKSEDIIVLTLVSVLILVGIDRIVVPRVIKNRM